MSTLCLKAVLKDGWSSKTVSLNVPLLTHPMLPVTYVDPRWARPFRFRDFSNYIFADRESAMQDFPNYVAMVNTCSSTMRLDRYKQGLLKIVDDHIRNYGRLVFTDLLMYVDCMAYLCYATDLMTEEQIVSNYASWVKYVVDNRKSYIKSSTRWGPGEFSGSQNEADLRSSL